MNKRVAFIDHSFHQKSTATFFLLDMLRQEYDVEIFWDESWINGPRADISRLGKMGFDTAIFFQVIDKYSAAELKNSGCRNIVLIPMYDHSGSWSDVYWLQYRDFKVVNFSKALHQQLGRLGIRSRYFQFFLPPAMPAAKVCKDNGLRGFFWQRTGDITWEHIRTLVEGADFRSFHLHLAVDPPGCDKIEPTDEEIRKYNITLSEWFDNREDYFKATSRANVFFVPRLYEGIGMSFVEAMAQGKFIVAPDHPTMNEYITHGINGLLYNPAAPRPLTFPSADAFAGPVIQSATEGYSRWCGQGAELLDFIFSDMPQKAVWSFVPTHLEVQLRKIGADRAIEHEIIENLRERIQASVDLLGQQAEEIARRNMEITRLAQELGRRDVEINRQAEDLMKKKEALSNIHASLSWRITRPFRFVNDSVERLLRNVRNNSMSNDEGRAATTGLPLVSIITPVFNGARWIDACIRSVLQQDYPRIEHIIVDGGSADETLEICKKYPHLVIHSKKDRGQSHAINKGFAMAQGSILAWLCADDEYEPGAVSAVVKDIQLGHSVVMGYSRFTDADGNFMSDHPANQYSYYSHYMFLRFWRYPPVSQPAIFWTRAVWEACGPLRENLYFAMDYDLWLRMSRKVRFERVHTYIARYRIHPDAKCFADNYGSRIELINVSRRYWPSSWTPHYWKLSLMYKISPGGITQHYADAERLLDATMKLLDNRKRFGAVMSFIRAHVKHVATPLMPGYAATLKRILGEGMGLSWVGRRIKTTCERLTLNKRVVISLSSDGNALILKAESKGYRDPEFKFWAKKQDEFVLLQDWGPQSFLVLSGEYEGLREFGVHLRARGSRAMDAQAWVKAV